MRKYLSTVDSEYDLPDEVYVFPASFAQQRLWFLDRFDPGIAHYTISKVMRLVGHLDVQALEKAFHDIMQRHEVLRTHFEERDGETVQVISQNALVELPLVDLTDLPDQPRESMVEGMLREELRRPFDLGRGPLIRASLWKLANQEHTLLISMHHIISDGWSMGILWQELSALYRAHRLGEPSPLQELPIQYADFATWQRDRLQGDEIDVQLNYWKGQLADLRTLELPLDRPRPASLGYTGAQLPVSLSPAVSAALKGMGQREDATLFMTTLTLFQVLLSRFSGSQDIVIGTPIANRNRTEIEPLIGFFVNTLVLRSDLSGNPSLLEALKHTRDTCFDAYDHQDLPFERLVEELRPPRDLSRHPLFQIMFTLQNAPAGELALEGLTVQAVGIPSEIAKFDLTLSLRDTPDGIGGHFEYNTDLFDASTIARISECFTVLAQNASAEPSRRIADLPLLTEAASHRLLVEWNATAADYPTEPCLHNLFEAQVMRTPGHVALVCNNQQLTYGELNKKANQLANYLQSLGVGPDVLVGLCLERSVEMVVALLGVLKAGGAYVPLDPQYPKERLAFMREDAGVAVLLTQKKWLPVLAGPKAKVFCLDSGWERMAAESEVNPACAATGENLAYVIYTSGSTGTPKGVMIPHQAICNHMHWMQSCFPLNQADRVLQKTPFSFDASIWEFYAPLLTGARLIMAKPGSIQDTQYLVNTIVDQQVTVLQVVPSLLRMLLEPKGIEIGKSLRRVFCGGEALPVDLHERFFEKMDAELINLYGPTEACIDATFWRCERGSTRRVVPIGGPISNTQIYVLDSHLNPLPIGVRGELHIGGCGLAKGYLNQPELTAEKFIPDPFSSQPGARLYKTGDLACYLPDGSVNYLGRKDHQVKLRGFRIELGEIEAVLKKHRAVHEAVVQDRADTPGDIRLVAYVVFVQAQKSSISELRSFLTQKLPKYMVPAAFVFLDDLPLTPNGKVDRRLLPAPDTDRPQLDGGYVAPWTQVQELLAAIWCTVLGLERVGVHDNFFELGGHSLLATRVISRVRAAFDVDLPVRLLFEQPTVAGLALHISGRSTDAQAPPLLPVPRKPYMPTSFAQRRLWFLDRFHPGLPLYNIHTAVHLDGVLNRGALADALNEMARRQESLRTTFQLVDGEPMQVIAAVKEIALPVVDLSEMPEGDRAEALNRIVQEEKLGPFDLSMGPLLRIKLLCQASDQHILLITMHHIISDGWSMEVLFRELEGLYTSFCSTQQRSMPDLPVQYADYAVWQHAWLEGETIENHLNYWKEVLRGAPPVLELPMDHPRPASQRYHGGRHSAAMPLTLSEGLKNLSLQEGVSLFMTLSAAFQVLLHRYTGCEDIVVGSPVAGRNHAEIENLIGFFVNTVALRTDFAGDPTFKELLRRVREVALGAFEHQDLPFEKLVEALNPERQESHHPLIQVMFALQRTRAPSVAASRWTIMPERAATGYAKFDLTLFINVNREGIVATVEYSSDLFDRTTMERMLGHFQTLLEGIVSSPERRVSALPLLGELERHQLLAMGNCTVTHHPKRSCVHERFEMQAKQTPEAVALDFEGVRLSYGELDRQANQLANYLRSSGVGPDVLVGICMERSCALVVGLLAVLKAGGAYVPLDPAYPAERLAFMLAESNPPVVLTQKRFAGLFHGKAVFCLDGEWETISDLSQAPPQVEMGSDHLAYVMYTSGSTGRPKGVCVPHRAISRLVVDTNYISLKASDRVANASNTSFDAATFEIWGALLNGARLVGMTTDDLLSPQVLVEKLRKKRISVLFLTTALFNQIAAEVPTAFKTLGSLLFGGEAVDPTWVRTVLEKGPPERLLHVYGPTENTTFSTWYEVKAIEAKATTVPIGTPISETQGYILDRRLNPVPVGVSGELYLGGDGLAKGYYRRPDLTREKFISNPFAGTSDGWIYRTGDLARYLPDGAIEFIGRIDNQVKLRGFRIELGEIEHMLKQHPGVHDAVGLLREDTPGDKRIAAYVVSKTKAGMDVDSLRAFVQDKLPEYMLPSAIVPLDALPLTPNGKVDRKALPAPTVDQMVSSRSYHPPRDPLEFQIVKIWEKILNLRPIGIQDNFFELGGHSLLTVQVLSQIKKSIGSEIAIADLFRHPTIEQLCEVIRRNTESLALSHIRPYQTLGSNPPFFCIFIATADAAHLVNSDQPFYGGAPHGFNGRRIPSAVEVMVADFIKEIKAVQPKGPYFIGGYSFGGMLAFEIARQLQEQGEIIGLLLLLDPATNERRKTTPLKKTRPGIASGEADTISAQLKEANQEVSAHPFRENIRRVFTGAWRRVGPNSRIQREVINIFFSAIVRVGLTVPLKRRKDHSLWTYRRLIKRYTPKQYVGKAVLIRSSDGTHAPEHYWRKYISEPIEVHEVPGGHLDLFKEPNVHIFAEKLKMCLKQAQTNR